MSAPKGDSRLVREPSEEGVRALSNIEIVALAVYALGGDSRFVDTEDIAMKANELTPGRFIWAKYPEQVNIHTIMTHLWDAKSGRKGSLLVGSEKEGWMLTVGGLALARSRAGALKGMKAARPKLTAGERQWMRGERVRMLNSDAFRKAVAEGVDSVLLEEAETFFRLNNYVVGEARERKLIRVVNAFGDDEKLGPTVKALADKVRRR